jgi:hypothetical protein
MADQVVQCGACRVDVRVAHAEGGDVVRCPICSRSAPKDEAVQMARSALIAVVMRDLPENLREVVRGDAALGYKESDHYDWVLDGGGSIGGLVAILNLMPKPGSIEVRDEDLLPEHPGL